MIKIVPQDSILDIITKIEASNEEKIILSFSTQHPLLHDYIALKTLKNKSQGKELIILANSSISKKIGRPLGIKYKLLKNTVPEGLSSHDLMIHNFGYSEFIVFEAKRYLSELKSLFTGKKSFFSPHNLKHKKYKKENKIYMLLAIFLVSSLILFLFVFYFAVNKTYIYITPEINIQTKSRNILYKDIDSNQIIREDNVVRIKKIESSVREEFTFQSSGIIENSISLARGEVTFYNLLEEDVSLLKNTRLESGTGILYLTQERVFLPAAKKDETGALQPSTTTAKIISKIYNKDGVFQGKKANIKNTTFVLPGLTENRDKIYAKTLGSINGGRDTYSRFISEEDFNNARAVLTTKLKDTLLTSLREKVREENKNSNIQYKILGIDNILTYETPSIGFFPDTNIGDKQEKFVLQGTISGNTFIYNSKSVLNKFSQLIQNSIVEGNEQITEIDEKSIRISNVLYRKDSPTIIKATTEIDFLVEQDFSNNENAYIEKLKGTILGLPKEKAENILLNDKKISNIEINIRPFFIKTIGKIKENIIFKIQK